MSLLLPPPRRLRALATALGALALTAGCANVRQDIGAASMFYRDYTGPAESEPNARIRLSAQGVLRITPNSSCADFTKQDTGVALFSSYSMKDYSHLHNRTLGMVGQAPAGLTTTEVRLRAGAPVVITYNHGWQVRGTAYSCMLHQQFTPQAGAQYQFTAQPLIAEGKCGLQLLQLSADAPPVPVALSATTVCGAPPRP